MPDAARSLVTVVIPAFNAAPWIGAAVASARAQTYAPVEIIVADNGSTDDTERVAREAGADSLLRVARRGPSSARNAALDAAGGEFIQLLDADDLLAPDKIARQVAILRATGADVAWGDFTRFDEATSASPFAARAVTPALGEDVAADLIRAGGFLHVGAALVRSAALAGTRFDESMTVVEDVRFLLALALDGRRFVRDDAPPGYALREHDSAARASRVREDVFVAACTANARFLRDAWRSRGEPLTPARVSALTGVLLYAAEVTSRTSPERLPGLLAELRELDPQFRRQLRRSHRAIVPVLGYRRTFALAESVRRLRESLRGR
jgi:glycosyltransferase involved in cell wall biosynthesis